MTLKQIQRMRQIHRLIKAESTGTPAELARRLHISTRQLYNMLDYMKDIGAGIKYSRSRQTYYYENEFDILVNISVEILLKDESYKIFGGRSYLIEDIMPDVW